MYDTSDPDWTLVGVNSDFGFAPSNYIELLGHAAPAATSESVPEEPPAPSLPQRPTAPPVVDEAPATPASPVDPTQNPAAAAIADIIHKQNASPVEEHQPPTPRAVPPPQPMYEPEESYREPSPPPPSLPQRPPSQQVSPPIALSPPEPARPPRPQVLALKDDDREGHVKESPPYNRVGQPAPRSPSGYHMYNINEMVEAMGKRKKMPTTLGINVATGTIFISPEGDGEHQEWTAEKLSHYSIEGKHVFVDLVRPSKSIDFHAGAKDTAREIVAALGEICGAYRAEGLKEVIAASSGGGGNKQGQILYDFMAQGDDEVTVAAGDEVVVIDDTKSEEWWMVRRMKNGKEGVVPSSYVEVTGFLSKKPTEIESGLSSVEKNRLEESRLAKDALKKSRTGSIDSKGSDRQKGESKSRTKPDPSKTRRWTDRTKTFTVDAQFIGLQDGQIHLHKVNGIKIAVPIPKMSAEDLRYVEKVTNVSLEDDRPLSDIRRRNSDTRRAGASLQQSDYDWFDFFLKAGVGLHQCERYAQNFLKDSMDESVLPDITPENLRTLGLKEGDILRVMRYLDSTLGRTGPKSKARNVSFGGEEIIGNGEDGGPSGLFSGPGGVLHNNTRKSRPAPAVQTSDVVDPKAFEQKDVSERKETPPAAPEKPIERGFDDDAWEVKHPKPAAAALTAAPAATVTATSPTTPAKTSPPPFTQQQLTGALADLSVLHPPLQPQPTATPQPQPAIQPQPTVQAPPLSPQQPQPTGASPGFFNQLSQQPTGLQQPARQRPQAPQNVAQNSLIPPPPPRPLSAPQNFSQQPSSFGATPLQPQLTGIPQTGPQVAPPGQSLAELSQQRFQPSLQPQPTGFQPQPQFGIQQQQQLQGQQPQFGFQGLAPQSTGFGGFQPQQPMQTGINSALQPALQPQPTGLQSQATGMNGFGGSPFASSPPPVPPVPPIPQQPTAAPLQAQKTGPPPSVRFGVKPEDKKLTPQATGMKANLAQASKFSPRLSTTVEDLIINALQRPRTHLDFSLDGVYNFCFTAYGF